MGKGKPRQEIIWLNYESDGHKIANDKLLIAKRYVDVTGGVNSAERYLARITRLLALPVKQRLVVPSYHSRQPWKRIDDDGSRFADTRLLIAKHYAQMMGSVDTAYRYCERIRRLQNLFR